MSQGRILVVDDEESIRWVFQKGLEKNGYEVHTAATGQEGLSKVEGQDYTLIFLDIRLPDMSGLEVLEALRQGNEEIPVVVITAQNTMRNAIEAMRGGAFDYLVKPFDLEQISFLLEKAQGLRALKKKVRFLEEELKERLELEPMVGRHPGMQEIFKTIGKIADKDVNVLIRGESGTGKELVARALHYSSIRIGFPFIAVNCAAIPKELLESEIFGHEKGAFTGAVATKIGKFEEADGGTLFLDEIGDMDLAMQSKLLRVIQEKSFRRLGGAVDRQVDVRLLAATNQNLEELMERGLFREDLFYRLNVVTIILPPLRERREDIPDLVEHFLQKFRRELGVKVNRISPEALGHLINYEWKGNVRELENVIKRAAVLATTDTILPEALPCAITRLPSDQSPKKLSLEELLEEKLKPWVSELGRLGEGDLYPLVTKAVEKVLFQLVLQVTKGNQVKAAALLGINRNTLRKKVTELGLDPKKIGN